VAKRKELHFDNCKAFAEKYTECRTEMKAVDYRLFWSAGE